MRTLEQALRWTAIAGAFLLPFVVFYVATSMFFPFITGKNFYFRIMVEIMAAAWLSLALVLPQYRPRRSWILAAFALFVFVMAIADALGVNPFKSFWSNFERMDGWITLAHLLVYVAVTVSVLHTENLWRRLFQLSLAISIIVGFQGVRQILGWTAVGQGGATGLAARIDATFGNAIYLAVYDLFNIFLAALLWAQEWRERRVGKRLWMSVAYGAIIVFDTFILLFTGTRGATLGLIGGAVLAGLIYVVFEPSARKVRTYVLSSIAVLVVLAGLLVVARDTQFVKDVGFLARLANISLNDPTFQTRFMNIGMALKGFAERPVLGWGQENYAIVFDKYYDPRMYNAEPWFDRVHNSFFDWLVAGGVVGLASYLSIFGAFLYALWRKQTFALYERAILTGLMSAYFVQNLTVFDNITSYILFATVLGYVAWRDGQAQQSARIPSSQFIPGGMLAFGAVGSCVIVGALGWYANAAAISQNLTLINSLVAGNQGRFDIALSEFQKAADIGALGTQEVREQFAQAAAQIAGSSAPQDLKQKFVSQSVAEMQKQAEISPLDARFPLFIGLVYQSAGDLENARKALEKAHELSPTKQSIFYELGQNALARNDGLSAVNAFRSAYEVWPGNIEARLYYAALLIRANQDALADEILAPAIKTGQAADKRIASAYGARKMYAKIAEIWEARIAAMPYDTQAYLTLSAAYYAGNNSLKAIATLEKLIAQDPTSAAEAQSYIAQIKNGTAPKPE